MDYIAILLIIGIAVFVVFFGKILTHALKFAFYALLVALVVVFVFGISLTDIVGFVRNLVFATF